MSLLSLPLWLCVAFGSARELHAPVPETPLYVSLAWPGFARDAAFERNVSAQVGADKLVLAGSIEAESATLTLLVESNRSQRSSAQLRDAVSNAQATKFQSGAIACTEQRVTLGKGVANDFHGFLVAGGLCFDVHATGGALEGEPVFDRKAFTALLEGIVVSFPRRGTASDLPVDVRELMHGALCEWPRWSEWLDGQRRLRRDDVALEFARGELAVLARDKPDAIADAHRASLALFGKLRNPSTPQRFAWMLAEESLGLACAESGKVADSVEPLRKSFEIADQLKRGERAAIAYNLARSCAVTGMANDAIKYLNVAISSAPQHKKVAAEDRAFASLAADKRFQALVR
jgi:tetratricopeptide (TPR) repeat protein